MDGDHAYKVLSAIAGTVVVIMNKKCPEPTAPTRMGKHGSDLTLLLQRLL